MSHMSHDAPGALTAMKGVYFVREADRHDPRTKIGLTTSLTKRLNSLATMSPSQLEVARFIPYPDATDHQLRLREAAFHKRFAPTRLHGEWFRTEGELAAWLDEPFTLWIDDRRCATCGRAVGAIWFHPDEAEPACPGHAEMCDDCGVGAFARRIYTVRTTGRAKCVPCWTAIAEQDGWAAHPTRVIEARKVIACVSRVDVPRSLIPRDAR